MKDSEFLISSGISSQIFDPVYWIDFLPVIALKKNLGDWILLRLRSPYECWISCWAEVRKKFPILTGRRLFTDLKWNLAASREWILDFEFYYADLSLPSTVCRGYALFTDFDFCLDHSGLIQYILSVSLFCLCFLFLSFSVFPSFSSIFWVKESSCSLNSQ